MHVEAVADKAARLANTLFADVDAEALKAAAWLHDLGYAPDIRDTGFHPLDGAVWLREAGFEGRVCGLVAYHTCADIEAEVRGFAYRLKIFVCCRCAPVCGHDLGSGWPGSVSRRKTG